MTMRCKIDGEDCVFLRGMQWWSSDLKLQELLDQETEELNNEWSQALGHPRIWVFWEIVKKHNATDTFSNETADDDPLDEGDAF